MKIAFNGVRSGLGNGGGSRTIVLSSKILEKLGHRCDIITTVDNFTWFDHKSIIPYFPSDLDAIINIAAVDYEDTRKSNVPVKMAWWRAHEIWSNTEGHLQYCYRNTEVKNLVNSKGFQQQISMYGADSKVVYQGIDFELWRDKNLRPKNKIRIGALYTNQPRKRWVDFVKLVEILGQEDYEYVSVGNANPNEAFLSKSIYNVGHEELRDLYGSCHIWFAPTDSEGLHNVPMEASLCGCLIVCADEPLNGMIYDYAFNDNTAMVYDRKDVEHAADLIRNPNWGLIKNMQAHLKNNIGTREDNMRKMISYLEKR